MKRQNKRKKNNYPIKKDECRKKVYLNTEFEFCTEEVWNLNNFIANYVFQGLRAYKNHDKAGVPWGFENMDEWNATIQKMIDAFDLLRNVYGYDDEDKEIVEEGLDLFRKYFRHLWD